MDTAYSGNQLLKEKSFQKYYLGKLIVNVLMVCIIMAITVLFIEHVQNEGTRRRQTRMSLDVLNTTVKVMDENASTIVGLTEKFHSINQQTIDNVEMLFISGAYSALESMTPEECMEYFAQMKSDVDTDYMYLIDTAGTVILSDQAEQIGASLSLILSDQAISDLTTNTESKRGSTEYVPSESGVKKVYKPVEAEISYGGQSARFFFYSTPIGDSDYFILLGFNTNVLDLQLGALRDVGSIINSVTVGQDGFLFAVDKATGKFMYFDDGATTLTDRYCVDVGLDYNDLVDGDSATLKFNGNTYYCVSKDYKSDFYGDFMLISAAVTTQSLYGTDDSILFFTIAVVVVCVFAVLIYSAFINNDFLRTKKVPSVRVLRKTDKGALYFNRSIAKNILVSGLLAIMVVSIFSTMFQTYFTTVKTTSESFVALKEIETQFVKDSENDKFVEEYYEKLFISKAKLLSYVLEEDVSAFVYDNESSDVHVVTEKDENGRTQQSLDEYGNTIYSSAYNELLSKLAEVNELDYLYVFNDRGQVIATNSSEWYAFLDEDTGFGDVLTGKTPSKVIKETLDNGEDIYRYAASFNYYTYDDEGKTVFVSKEDYVAQQDGVWTGERITRHRSLVQIAFTGKHFTEIISSTGVDDVLEQIKVPNDGKLVVFSSGEGNEVLYSFNQSDIGKKAEETGFTKETFDENYKGFVTKNTVEYYVVLKYTGDYYTAILTPTNQMYADRGAIVLINAIAVFVCIVFLSAMFTLHTETEQKAFTAVKWESEYDAENEAIYITMPSGKTKKVIAAVDRWNDATIPWKRKTSEAKIFLLLQVVLFIAVTGLMIYYAVVSATVGQDNLLVYIARGNFDRGLNFFSIAKTFLAFMVFMSMLSVLGVVTIILSSTTGTRIETMGRLIVAIIKLLGIFALILYCLYLFGFDTTSLLASAGIMSVIIGLGAQSLIGDVLAGIFIVLEGSFRVGDIITLDGYRGQVLEIGLRTTKVQDVYNNIKVFNNSSITGVMNMTKENSIASCNVGIEYSEDIEKLEEIFKKELPTIKQRINTIIEGPYYRGITSFDASWVNILFETLCNEQQRIPLERALNRELFLIFKKYDINIPYSQITVSYRNDAQSQKQFEELRNLYDPAPNEDKGGKKKGDTEK